MRYLAGTIRIAIVLFFAMSCGSTRNSNSSTPQVIIVGRPAPDSIKKVTVKYSNVQVKYAAILGTTPNNIINSKLYQCIDDWMGTPYRWGGVDKSGIDCSAFVRMLLDSAYNISIKRTSIEQFFANYIDRFVSTRKLSEGDLVFFATFGDNVVSHVGMYLCNGQFINSSSSKGVSLGDLKDPYWKSRYVAAGRIKMSLVSIKK